MQAFEKLKLQMALDNMRATKAEVMAYQCEMAQLLYNHYAQLKKAGFSPFEALRIVLDHGAFPKTPDNGSSDK